MAEYGLNLWDYWRIVYKRKWVILIIFLAAVASSHFFGQKYEPIYRSNVTLYFYTSDTPIAEITGAGVTFWGGGSNNMETQLELITSYTVLKDVAAELGYINDDMDEERQQAIVYGLRGKIRVHQDETSSLVRLSATDSDPLNAKLMVETVALVFIQHSWERKVKDARTTKEFVEKQLIKLSQSISDIKKKLMVVGIAPSMTNAPADMGGLRARLIQLKYELSLMQERFTDNYPDIIGHKADIEAIEKQIGVLPEAEAEDGVEGEYIDAEQLQNELVINQKLYALLKERYEKARILEASKTKDIEIVDPATFPRSPLFQKTTVNVFLGGLIGLVLGLVAAFVTESMDTSIDTIEDVEEYLRMPVLSIIPQIEGIKADADDFWKTPPPAKERKRYADITGKLVVHFKPKSPVAEAYKNLQTYIKFSGVDKFGNCLMFTSAGIREGKTLTSVNSALSMAQLGYKVLLVDADLRRPSVHKLFGIKRDIGLTDALLGTFKVEDVTKNIDDLMMGNIKSSYLLGTYGLENLKIITAGHMAVNPTELLGSQSMTDFIKQVKEEYQIVFVDSAPVLPVTDTCILSSKVDGVILVYEVGRVSRGALRRVKMQIENAKGTPIGVVLNSMRASDMRFGSPFYYYGQQGYYGEHKEGDEPQTIWEKLKAFKLPFSRE